MANGLDDLLTYWRDKAKARCDEQVSVHGVYIAKAQRVL